MKAIFAALSLVLGTGTAQAVTITVCGSGCNVATITEAFANYHLAPGDVVEIRDSRTYTEEIYWGGDDSGSAGNPVTLRAAAWQYPTIDGGIYIIGGDSPVNYTKIGDLESTGQITVTHSATGWADGAIILRNANYGTVENTVVHDVPSGNGINMQMANYNTIQNNTIYAIGTSNYTGGTSGEGIIVYQDGIGNIIQNNTVHDSAHSQIGVYGTAGQVTRTSKNQILNNTIYGGRGSGISCLHSEYCLIDGNIIYNTAQVQTNLSKSSIQLTGANRSSVRRNVIYNGHHYYAFEMSVYSDNAHVEDNYVYNNTVHTYGGPAVYLGGKGTNSLVRNNKFYNNIFWNINTIGEPGWWWGDGTHKIIFLGWYDGASSGADWGASLRELNASGLGGHDIKNNILRSNAGAGSGYILGYQSVGGAYVYDNSLANMQSSFPTAISGNIESDPLFAGTPPATNWWHLQSHSPAKDAGRVVNDPNAATGGWKPLTYNGSAPDIGAFEY